MSVRFDLSGRATLSFDGEDGRALEYVRTEMDPYDASGASADPAPVDVVLEPAGDVERAFDELQKPAGDDIVTAADSSTNYVLYDGRWCSVPEPLGERPATFRFQEGFPLWRVFSSVVRPALQVAMIERGAVAIHCGAVEMEGGGVVVGGWSESGKTETALALMETGARFISDKWTIVASDGTIAAFPIGVGIRRWVLEYLPQLRSALPRRARAQLAAAGVAAAATRPARARPARGRMGGLAVTAMQRAVALGDRAALRPSEVRAAYGQSADASWTASLRTVAVLTTIPAGEPVALPAEPRWAARRLARAAAFERRGFFALHERARYALPELEGTPAREVEQREEELLEGLLMGKQVLEVKTPFPTDPRRVADAIARAG